MLRYCGQLIKLQSKPLVAFTLKKSSLTNGQYATQSFLINRRAASTSLAGPNTKAKSDDEKVTPMGWFLLVSFICWKI